MAIDTNNYLLAIVAVAQSVTSYLAYRAQRDAAETRKDAAIVRQDTAQTRQDMRTVEKATNSMKDALVAATERAAGAEGMAKGIIQGLEQGKAEGVLEGKREEAHDRQTRESDSPG